MCIWIHVHSIRDLIGRLRLYACFARTRYVFRTGMQVSFVFKMFLRSTRRCHGVCLHLDAPEMKLWQVCRLRELGSSKIRAWRGGKLQCRLYRMCLEYYKESFFSLFEQLHSGYLYIDR